MVFADNSQNMARMGTEGDRAISEGLWGEARGTVKETLPAGGKEQPRRK